RYGQRGEKFLLLRRQLLARPGDRFANRGVHVGRAARDRFVVVALDDQRTVLRMVHHQVDNRASIGAVADEVAEKRKARRAVVARMPQARLQRFEIGVHIGQQGQGHARPPATRLDNIARCASRRRWRSGCARSSRSSALASRCAASLRYRPPPIPGNVSWFPATPGTGPSWAGWPSYSGSFPGSWRAASSATCNRAADQIGCRHRTRATGSLADRTSWFGGRKLPFGEELMRRRVFAAISGTQ